MVGFGEIRGNPECPLGSLAGSPNTDPGTIVMEPVYSHVHPRKQTVCDGKERIQLYGTFQKLNRKHHIALIGAAGVATATGAVSLERAGRLHTLAPTCVVRPAQIEGPYFVDEQMRAAAQAIDDAWGRLDIVFANAGINGVWAPIDEIKPDEWRQTVDVNLNGTYLTLHHSVPLLKRQGGSIIITSSVNGTRRFTGAGASAYASTKAAQVALAQMLALELAKHGIRVNVICPGAIDTKIEEKMETRRQEEAGVRVEYPEGHIPLTGGEPGTSEQVADLVLFLASDRSSHITGTPVWIDGAQSLLQG
jgi:NAD(P)-dependent dehydrogenase (short-subunit alcohol dehydrogenase family)